MRVAVDFSGQGLDQRCRPSDIETAAFRIVQEALTNVHKHAAASRLKRAAAHELVYAIRAVAAGGTSLDPTLAGKVIGSFVRTGGRVSSEGPEVALSEREERVLRLVAQGFSNKEIAVRLEVGVKSVESYKARASQKLGFSGRADIINYALQKGWLQDR